jgi:hypothetical protein
MPKTTKKTTKKKTAKRASSTKPIKQECQPNDLQLIYQMFLDSDKNPDTLKILIDHQERMKAEAAKKAFLRAKIKFASMAPKIIKDSHSNEQGWSHAQLGKITEMVLPLLSECELVYQWKHESIDDFNKCICILTHVDGHFETNTMTGPPDYSDNKNDLQALGSSNSYLQKYTLLPLLGLAAANDDDGFASSSTGPVRQLKNSFPLSSEQIQTVEAEIKKHKVSKQRFFTWLKNNFNITKINEIPETAFDKVMKTIASNSKAKPQADQIQPGRTEDANGERESVNF